MAKAKKSLAWNFPGDGTTYLRIEIVSIAIIAAVVFFISFFHIGQSYFVPTIVTVAFIILYTIISYLIRRLRQVEENYKISATHFQVTRKTKKGVKKEKVSLKKIQSHNLDRFFLGGYMISEEGKHLLFFNSIKELEDFDKHIKKHIKK